MTDAAPLRVLRVYHSGVVTAWRRRDAELERLGAEPVLVSAATWDEAGGRRGVVRRPEERVIAARTLGRHPYRFLYDPRPLWRELRRRPLDVLDVHEEPAALATLEVLVLARLAGQGDVPFCVYSAQNIPKRYPPPFRWIERWVLRRAAAAHTCNEAAGAILAAKGLHGEVEDLGLGVDPGPAAPASVATGAGRRLVDRVRADGCGRRDDRRSTGTRPEDGRTDQGPCLRVGFVGRVEADKGIWVLLDAVDGLDGVHAHVVGWGPELGALRREALRRGAPLTVHGPMDPADGPALLAALDVVVVPSLTTPSWAEQFGRVAVEAMAAGAAVVASDSGALPEVVGDAGLVVPEGDAVALAEALAHLRDEPTERDRLAIAGRERARRWSWPAIAARQLGLYRRMAAGRSRA